MKGLYKAGFKYISNIFVVKEREMEIGLPTDVKHVAHIGWDGPAGAAPSWMNEFRTAPQFAATSIGNSGLSLSPWSSQDYAESLEHQSMSGMLKEDVLPSSDLPSIPKGKLKRKKIKSNSSPGSATATRSSLRGPKSKSKFVDANQNAANIEVA